MQPNIMTASATLRIFVINLARHAERRALMKMQLDALGLPYEFFDAVDGFTLSPDFLKENYDAERARQLNRRDLSLGEIGCALSHLAIYKKMVDENIPLALIFEDDALIGSQFPEILERLVAQSIAEDETIMLLSHTHKYSGWFGRKIDRNHRLVPAVEAYYAHAYLVTLAAARKLCATLPPVHAVADCWNYLIENKQVRVRSVVPYCVGHSLLAKQSAIQPNRAALEATAKRNFLWDTVKKIVFDKLIYQVSIKPLLRIHKQPITW